MVLFTVAAVLVFSLFMPVRTVLVLEGQGSHSEIDKIFAEYEAKEGMTFSVSFIHSVNKSKVEETYEIRDGKIYLVSCLYSSFGAGVATEIENGQTLTYTDEGEMLISGIDHRIDGLSYIVGTVSDHVLKVNNKEVSLRELCGKNSTVRFAVKKQVLYDFIKS